MASMIVEIARFIVSIAVGALGAYMLQPTFVETLGMGETWGLVATVVLGIMTILVVYYLFEKVVSLGG